VSAAPGPLGWCRRRGVRRRNRDAAAAHPVLAKTLYLVPPPGLVLAVADQEHGAEVMYCGGDLVEFALALVIGMERYAARGRPPSATCVERSSAAATPSGAHPGPGV
jgi:putative membrane protein